VDDEVVVNAPSAEEKAPSASPSAPAPAPSSEQQSHHDSKRSSGKQPAKQHYRATKVHAQWLKKARDAKEIADGVRRAEAARYRALNNELAQLIDDTNESQVVTVAINADVLEGLEGMLKSPHWRTTMKAVLRAIKVDCLAEEDILKRVCHWHPAVPWYVREAIPMLGLLRVRAQLSYLEDMVQVVNHEAALASTWSRWRLQNVEARGNLNYVEDNCDPHSLRSEHLRLCLDQPLLAVTHCLVTSDDLDNHVAAMMLAMSCKSVSSVVFGSSDCPQPPICFHRIVQPTQNTVKLDLHLRIKIWKAMDDAREQWNKGLHSSMQLATMNATINAIRSWCFLYDELPNTNTLSAAISQFAGDQRYNREMNLFCLQQARSILQLVSDDDTSDDDLEEAPAAGGDERDSADDDDVSSGQSELQKLAAVRDGNMHMLSAASDWFIPDLTARPGGTSSSLFQVTKEEATPQEVLEHYCKFVVEQIEGDMTAENHVLCFKMHMPSQEENELGHFKYCVCVVHNATPGAYAGRVVMTYDDRVCRGRPVAPGMYSDGMDVREYSTENYGQSYSVAEFRAISLFQHKCRDHAHVLSKLTKLLHVKLPWVELKSAVAMPPRNRPENTPSCAFDTVILDALTVHTLTGGNVSGMSRKWNALCTALDEMPPDMSPQQISEYRGEVTKLAHAVRSEFMNGMAIARVVASTLINWPGGQPALDKVNHLWSMFQQFMLNPAKSTRRQLKAIAAAQPKSVGAEHVAVEPKSVGAEAEDVAVEPKSVGAKDVEMELKEDSARGRKLMAAKAGDKQQQTSAKAKTKSQKVLRQQTSAKARSQFESQLQAAVVHAYSGQQDLTREDWAAQIQANHVHSSQDGSSLTDVEVGDMQKVWTAKAKVEAERTVFFTDMSHQHPGMKNIFVYGGRRLTQQQLPHKAKLEEQAIQLRSHDGVPFITNCGRLLHVIAHEQTPILSDDEDDVQASAPLEPEVLVWFLPIVKMQKEHVKKSWPEVLAESPELRTASTFILCMYQCAHQGSSGEVDTKGGEFHILCADFRSDDHGDLCVDLFTERLDELHHNYWIDPNNHGPVEAGSELDQRFKLRALVTAHAKAAKQGVHVGQFLPSFTVRKFNTKNTAAGHLREECYGPVNKIPSSASDFSFSDFTKEQTRLRSSRDEFSPRAARLPAGSVSPKETGKSPGSHSNTGKNKGGGLYNGSKDELPCRFCPATVQRLGMIKHEEHHLIKSHPMLKSRLDLRQAVDQNIYTPTVMVVEATGEKYAIGKKGSKRNKDDRPLRVPFKDDTTKPLSHKPEQRGQQVPRPRRGQRDQPGADDPELDIDDSSQLPANSDEEKPAKQPKKKVRQSDGDEKPAKQPKKKPAIPKKKPAIQSESDSDSDSEATESDSESDDHHKTVAKHSRHNRRSRHSSKHSRHTGRKHSRHNRRSRHSKHRRHSNSDDEDSRSRSEDKRRSKRSKPDTEAQEAKGEAQQAKGEEKHRRRKAKRKRKRTRKDSSTSSESDSDSDSTISSSESADEEVRRKKQKKRKKHSRHHQSQDNLSHDLSNWIQLEEKLAEQRREDGRIAGLKVLHAKHQHSKW
jgi:hypothetical protein